MLGLGTLATTVPIKAACAAAIQPEPKPEPKPTSDRRTITEHDPVTHVTLTSEAGVLDLYVHEGRLEMIARCDPFSIDRGLLSALERSPIDCELEGFYSKMVGDWNVIYKPFTLRIEDKVFENCYYTQFTRCINSFSLSFICEG